MNLRSFYKTNPSQFITCLVFIFISSLLGVCGKYLLTPMANSLGSNNQQQFVLLIISMFVLYVINYALQFWGQYLFVKQSQQYNHKLRSTLIKKYYQQTDSSTLANKQNDLVTNLDLLYQSYLTPLYKALGYIPDILFSSIVVFTFNIYLLLLIIFWAIILLFLPKLFSKPLESMTNRVSIKNSAYLDTIQKWLSGLAVLKRYNVKNKLFKTLATSAQDLETSKIKLEKRSDIVTIILATVNITAQITILFVTGLLIINKIVSLGVIFSIGSFAGTIFSELQTLNSNLIQINSTKDLNKQLSLKLESADETNKNVASLTNFARLRTHSLSITFNNGETISYPDLQINAGEKILLSGDSGTGKSTLFKMILQELIPTKGTISFIDRSGKAFNPQTSEIGYIPQDPQLFPGTIRENITMFDDSLNSDVSYWVNEVELSQDLSKFPDGVDTVVNLDKQNLSGGQRQKVILARAKIHNSKILLIDEGTSAIDAISTMKILHNILQGSETIIFIAHNLTPEMHHLFDREIYLNNTKKA